MQVYWNFNYEELCQENISLLCRASLRGTVATRFSMELISVFIMGQKSASLVKTVQGNPLYLKLWLAKIKSLKARRLH